MSSEIIPTRYPNDMDRDPKELLQEVMQRCVDQQIALQAAAEREKKLQRELAKWKAFPHQMAAETMFKLQEENEKLRAEVARLKNKMDRMLPVHDDGNWVFIDGPGDVELDHGGKMRIRIKALEEGLREINKKGMWLRGDQSYRDYAKFVTRQAARLLKASTSPSTSVDLVETDVGVCSRCEEWSRMGLSSRCPACDAEALRQTDGSKANG